MDNVLILSGLDPSGGAGLSADIETINQFGAVALPIVTVLTVQNTISIKRLDEVDTDLITKQFNHLQDDIDFDVVKIGLLASARQIKTIAGLIQDKILVLDPIIKASNGKNFLDDDALNALKTTLLPLATIITPNVAELHALSGEKDEQQAIEKLDCEWTLLTTTDSSITQIEHRLYHRKKLIKRFYYQKLPGNYHGSGCTLASGIAALMAQGVDIQIACTRALDYTYQSLLNAKNVGKMQHHPNRQTPL